MVTKNIMCMHEGKQVFAEKKCANCEFSRYNQTPQTDQIKEIAPEVRNISQLPSNI